MTKYIIKRVLLLIPTVLGIILVLFILLYTFPTSTISRMPIHRGDDALDSLFSFLNAKTNIVTQYVRYCYNIIVHYDFGPQSGMQRNIANELTARLRSCLSLLGMGVGATLIIGIPLGVYTAVNKDSKRDRIINVIILFFSAIPNFTIAFLLTLFLCVYLRVLPLIPSYTQPIAYVLPALTLSVGGIASIARMTRTSMIEALGQPFVTALASKGLRESAVIYKHALKNALIPIISALGVLISQLLFGTLVVEYFFNIQGLGTYMLRAINSRANFEILGTAVVLTIVLAVTNLASDVLYAFVNPRIRLQYGKTDEVKMEKEAEA